MKKLLLAGVACILSYGAAQAVPVNILTPGLSITAGDLTFSNFTCSATFAGLSSGGCGGLNVDSLGTGITITGGLSAVAPLSGSPAASDLDVVIRYQVSSVGSAISGIGLNFNGSTAGPGTAFAEIIETVFSDAARSNMIGMLNVTTVTPTFSDSITLSPPVFTAYVEKDILLNAFAPGLTTATISIINQPFTVTPVPEPATLALFGTALLGLGLARRRRDQA